jgi:hypothetical protein
MAVLLIGGLLAVLPSLASAQPAPTVAAAAAPATSDCPPPLLFSALGAFGDLRSYFLAPGGDFEAPGWSLAGGATLADGSGPLSLGKAKGSLQLPPGGSATSPVFCVDLDYPTMRFFAAQVAARSSSRLTVDVIYPARGDSTPKAATIARSSSAWGLSPDVRLRPELVDRTNSWRFVQIRLTADKATAGDWRVDDVLVDPRMRG